MPRMSRLAAVLAVLAVLGGAIWFLLREGPPRADLQDDLPDIELARSKQKRDLSVEIPQGGVYAGVVVDPEGRPISGATVMLVAFNAGDDFKKRSPDEVFDPGDPSAIPTVGDYYIGGREATTGDDGRWRIPADSRARVTHALAYHRRYFLNVEKVGLPSQEVVIVLKQGGRVKGQVVDHESGRPVPNVQVDIYLQHPTALAPEYKGGASTRRTGRPDVKRSEIAMLGHFLAKELGERIWEIPYQGTEALRLRTNADGRFELGPLGEGVQLEFVVTHPDYRWFDFDTEGGLRRAKRTQVGPGETVEREFRLRKGERISGHVYDDEGKPIEGVAISFESITAWHRHWFDAIGKKRYAKSDAKGRFTIGGLAGGSHNLVLTHASFGKEYHHGAKAGTKSLDIYIKRRGRILGTIDGLDKRPVGGRIYIHLIPRGPKPQEQMKLVRKRHILDMKNRFGIEDVKSGPYEIWVQAGTQASMPQAIDVKPGSPVQVRFELGGGGSLEAELLDTEGRAIDPAIVHLIREDEKGQRSLGRYVTREGLLSTDNVVPGRYKLRVVAPGFITATSDFVEVHEGNPTRVGQLTLKRYSYLQLSSVMTDRRTTPKNVTIQFREGEKGAWRPLSRLTGFPIPVKPGAVTVKAVDDKGQKFERVYEALEGATFRVDVELQTK